MTNGYVDPAVCGEGFGPADTLVLVVGHPVDEPLRRAVRDVLIGHGGKAGAPNSIAYLFNTVGVLRYAATAALAGRALEAGAEDVRKLDSGELEVITDPDDLQSVRAALELRGHVARGAGLTRWATQRLRLAPSQAARLVSMIEALRAIDGVEQVYTNAELPIGA